MLNKGARINNRLKNAARAVSSALNKDSREAGADGDDDSKVSRGVEARRLLRAIVRPTALSLENLSTTYNSVRSIVDQAYALRSRVAHMTVTHRLHIMRATFDNN